VSVCISKVQFTPHSLIHQVSWTFQDYQSMFPPSWSRSRTSILVPYLTAVVDTKLANPNSWISSSDDSTW